MSRKVIITLAAAATIAAAGLASTSTYAHGFGGGGGGGFGGGHMSMARGGGGFARGGSGFGHGGNIGHSGGLRTVRSSGRSLRSARSSHPDHFGRHDRPILIGDRHHHHHWHWVLRGGRWIDVEDVGVETDVETPATAVELPPAVTPAPCTCLTKTYTPTGLVVFADVCTKESASAPATDDTADASTAPTAPVAATATPMSEVPTAPNYAGRTYDDYLAANPQSAQPQVSTQPSQQSPSAPQQN